MAACGICAGENSGVLSAAGCSTAQIEAWCSGNGDYIGGGTLAPTPPAGSDITMLLAGTQGPDDKPALLALDGASGETLWMVALPGPAASGKDGGWSVSALWAGPSTTIESTTPGKLALVIQGALSYTLDEPSRDVHAAEAEAVRAGEADAIALDHQRSRRQGPPNPPPPPPPPVYFKYFTWGVEV